MAPVLDREEYIEQAYFFRTLRERLAANMSTQEILDHVHEEILATTRLPYAVQFLATELKHSGDLSSGFQKLPHYFAPFQAFAIQQTESDFSKFPIEIGLLVLEREAQYRAEKVTQAGLFVYQFEALSRNRMGYEAGLEAMRRDPFYDEDWMKYIEMVQRQLGVVDFADMVYLRSEFYVEEQRRTDPDFKPSARPLFAVKEGKIAKANRGRDPLYLFAALQRQLGYPEVPRQKPRDDLAARLEMVKAKMRELETRLKLVEGEVRGHVDLTPFMADPNLLKKMDDED